MKHIGLLGGTFNPVHMGHLAMAQMALEKLHLAKVIFIPSCRPPHKNIINLAPAQDRLRMVKLAIKGNPLFDASDFEIKKGGKSYSIDTVRYFRKTSAPKLKLLFIIGGDSLPELSSWKRINEIVQCVSFIVVNRPGYSAREDTINLSNAPKKIKYHSVIMPDIDIASSYLRQRIVQGKSVRYFVPDNVCRYIERHALYKTKARRRKTK